MFWWFNIIPSKANDVDQLTVPVFEVCLQEQDDNGIIASAPASLLNQRRIDVINLLSNSCNEVTIKPYVIQ